MNDLKKIRPKADNVLVRFDMHERRREDKMTEGGIFIPRNRDVKANECVEAVVIAAGPGHYHDLWLGQQKGGSSPDGRSFFVTMSEHIKPGARVLVDGPQAGERIYSDEREEYRMVREHNIEAVIE